MNQKNSHLDHGMLATLRKGELNIDVIIDDVETDPDDPELDRYLIRPVSGTGSIWVYADELYTPED